uniref:Mitochondria-eating protein n=1 Tax=Elaeophora elaphi TaxID=1147741 RepID=A0A0R3RIU5_9BILA
MAKQGKKETTDRSFKKKDPFSAVKGKDKNSCYVRYEEIFELIGKFTNLYHKDGTEILRVLDELPEFRGSEDLQHKIVMLVIVLSYRSAQENVERRRRMIFELLGDQPSENEESENLDNALYRYMSRKAMDEEGIDGSTKI